MARLCVLASLCVCAMALSCKSGGGGEGGTAAVGGLGGGGGVGGAAGNGGMTACDPGSIRDCYTGPLGTENVGACMVGSEMCNVEGTGYGACGGEVLPSDEVPTLPGETPVDEDCDGLVDEAA